MGKVKRKSFYHFFQGYYFGSFLYVTIISLALAWSIALLASPPTAKTSQTPAKTRLALSSYKTTNQAAVSLPQVPKTQVLGISTEQPALESWQGPIDPLPDSPNQPSIPVITTVPTAEPIVFLTIDDGWVQTPEESVWLTQHHLPFTLFLTDNGIKNNYKFFQLLQSAGMSIEDHTTSHPDLTRLTPDQQKSEICGAADTYENVFGVRPTMLRPPYGKANQLTIQAAADCGMKQIVLWRAVVEKGVIHYQDNLTHLNPGDIVLMHFTTNFTQDIQAFINQTNSDHLQIANLEDWLP